MVIFIHFPDALDARVVCTVKMDVHDPLMRLRSSILNMFAAFQVLVHDLKMRLQTWSPVWDLLREDGHRIIAVDLPGSGPGVICHEKI